jgi:hypothetical protein
MKKLKKSKLEELGHEPETMNTSEVAREVLGPLTVIAEPVYAADDYVFPVLLATLPDGLAVAIEDTGYYDYQESPISIFRHLRRGDVIVCRDAVRADSSRETETTQKSCERRYHAGTFVYQLVEGKAIDLLEKLLNKKKKAVRFRG